MADPAILGTTMTQAPLDHNASVARGTALDRVYSIGPERVEVGEADPVVAHATAGEFMN